MEQSHTGSRLLRFDPVAKQFVRSQNLFPGRVVLSTPKGILVRPGESGSSRNGYLQWLPLLADGTVDGAGIRNLPGELYDANKGFPFYNRVNDPVAFAHGKLWYVNDIKKPDKPRYVHDNAYFAIVGYDPETQTWTTPRELPWEGPNGSVVPATFQEQDGRLIAAFDAPDGSVWQYEPERDDWRAIAPALPQPAALSPGGV